MAEDQPNLLDARPADNERGGVEVAQILGHHVREFDGLAPLALGCLVLRRLERGCNDLADRDRSRDFPSSSPMRMKCKANCTSRARKRDATRQAPRGCYARHCKAYDCTKNHVRQWFHGNYNQRTMHRHNPPNWMRRANHNSWGILFRGEVRRGTYGSFCGCSP